MTRAVSCVQSAASVPRQGTPRVRVEIVQQIMKRAGVGCPPAEFVACVASAFAEAQRALDPQDSIPTFLRNCPSFPVFQEALRRAGPARSVAVLGCGGEGIFGMGHQYAQQEWLRMWPQSEITCIDVTVPFLRDSESWPLSVYDAVISVSMVHYIFDLDAFFRMIRRLLRPGGAYVFGREANARYFRHPVLRQTWEEWRASRPRRSMFRRTVSGWRQRASGLFAESLLDRANLIAKKRFGFRTKLSAEDFRCLIEIHRPAQPPSPQQVGLNGFDPEDLVDNYLPGFRTEWLGSSVHLGYVPHESIQGDWKRRVDDLAVQYPQDGAYLSAVFRKSEMSGGLGAGDRIE